MKKNVWVCGSSCFLQHPCGQRGHYMKTDRCVAFVACEYCGAGVCEPCEGARGPMSGTHHLRRKLYQSKKNDLSVQYQVHVEDVSKEK